MGSLRAIWPLGPIFDKEMRQMARRKRSYLLRFCYLGVLLGVLTCTWLILEQDYRYDQTSIVVQAQRQAEMGQIFFGVFAVFSVVAMHLTGPILTSTAIGSERLRRTLDTLLMTPISAWQLVAGKLFSRLLTAGVLIGLSLPVLAVVRLLGGVELDDMFGALGLALSVAASSAAMGLLLSCWMKRAWAVILLSYILIGVAYVVLPMIGGVILSAMYRGSSNSSAAMVPIFTVAAALHPVMTTGIKITPGGAAFFPITWSAAIAVQCVITIALTAISAVVVRRIGRRQGEGEAVASMPSLPTVLAEPSASRPPPVPASVPSATSRGRPVSDRPVLWREMRQPLLPRRWHRVTATCATLALLLISYAALAADNDLDDLDPQYAYLFTMHTILLLMATVLGATSIATEKESDTWTLLIVTPLSGHAVVWSKFLGVIRRMRWPFALAVGHTLLFTIGGVLTPDAGAMVLWVMLTFSLPLIATGIFFSLIFRGVTAAVVCNLLTPVAIYGLVPLALAAIEGALSSGYGSPLHDLPELMLYYLPYYYMGPLLDDMVRRVHSAWLPFADDRVPTVQMLAVCFGVGVAHVALAAMVLQICAAKFDAITRCARSY